MSELIAEARVLVTPDTTTFRALLTTQLQTATSGVAVTVPVTPVVTGGAGAATAASSATKKAVAAEAAITKLAQAESVLAAADQKVAIASTQAGAARAEFNAATRAASIIQAAYVKALASEDDEVIELVASERALVRVRQENAVATLRAAQATAAEAKANQSAASSGGALAGARAAQQRATAVTASADAAAAAQARLAKAADIVSVAEKRAAIATSEVSAAQTRYGATIRATTTTFAAYEAALRSSDFLLVKQARDAFGAAKANEALALSNLQVARTQSAANAALTQGASKAEAGLRGLSSGAASSALSLVGLRGATLAATGPFLVGAAAAISLGKSLSLASSFASEIAVLGATTGATGEQLETAAAAAREFGRDISLPGVTAGDAAVTITSFAKAGLSLNESLAATRGGLQLAQAAQISYADAVELTANSLNAFNLSGSQAVVVADTLANAANLSQGSITDVALALRQSAGAAQVVGVSFQDTIALLTQLAQNGLTGSDAGTALRTSFIRLVNPSKAARQILQDLNVQLRDLQGNVRPEVFQEFAAAQRDLSVAQQQANAAIVFGQDAFRVIGILGQEAPDSLDRVRAGLDQTGTAAKIAQARMVGLRGASERLQNQLSDLGQEVGDFADGPLTVVIDQFASYVGVVGDAIRLTKDFGETLGGIELPERPPGVDFAVTEIFPEIFKTGNPFGQFLRVKDLLSRGSDEVEEEARRSGLEARGAIEDMGSAMGQGARSFQSEVVAGFQAGFDQINQAIRDGANATRAAITQSIGGAQGQAAGLAEQFNAIVGGGGSQQAQLANLRRQAAVQARIIAKAGPDAAGDILKARREAQQRLAGINQQIVSIEQQIASDARAAQDEAARIAQQAANDADRAFLQRQEDARTRAEQRITVAEDTPQLADDIRRQVQLRALLQQQIAALRTSAVNERTKAEAIRALRAAVFATTQEIKGLKGAQAEQRAEQRQAAQDQLAENLSLRTQIAEARGNDAAVVQALDAQIANAKKAQARAKKGSQEWLKATLALEQLKKQRRDVLKEMQEDEGSGGLSLADFLRENNALFQQISGSLGTVGVDPFSGFDFSKSITSTLTGLQDAARVGAVRVSQPVKTQTDQQIERLIEALNRNTEATNGNTSSGGFSMSRYVDVTGQRAAAMGAFWQARQARSVTEDSFDG